MNGLSVSLHRLLPSECLGAQVANGRLIVPLGRRRSGGGGGSSGSGKSTVASIEQATEWLNNTAR